MNKKMLVTNSSMGIGSSSPTRLNLLVGANDERELKSKQRSINRLQDNNSGVDIITDLSLVQASKGNRLWEHVIKETKFTSATVPVYLSARCDGTINEQLLLDSIYEQCEAGVSIITIHPSVTKHLIKLSSQRMIRITSRGGGIVAADLLKKGKDDNVYITHLDKIIYACKRSGTIISIGSSFRSGTIMDANDDTYREELKLQMKIADYISAAGVGVMIETPGHADPISLFRICDLLKNIMYPIMPLGPMPTDIGFEDDDTAGAIGAVLMGTRGCADVLTIVTRVEHLAGKPNVNDYTEAIRKYEIAKHVIDLYKIGDKSVDKAISERRSVQKSCHHDDKQQCKRCGNFCPLKLGHKPIFERL